MNETSISTEIIKVLDDLAEKFGIAIDWTSENIIPYLKEFLERYVTYGIVKNSIGLFIGFVLLIMCIIFTKKVFKSYEKCEKTVKDNLIFEICSYGISLTDFGMFTVISAGCITVISLVVIGINLLSLIQWVFIPEVNIIEDITSYLSCM